jgi:hypothetical protein
MDGYIASSVNYLFNCSCWSLHVCDSVCAGSFLSLLVLPSVSACRRGSDILVDVVVS